MESFDYTKLLKSDSKKHFGTKYYAALKDFLTRHRVVLLRTKWYEKEVVEGLRKGAFKGLKHVLKDYHLIQETWDSVYEELHIKNDPAHEQIHELIKNRLKGWEDYLSRNILDNGNNLLKSKRRVRYRKASRRLF